MANLNRVFLIGNLTRDPDVRYTPKGIPVAEIGLAINRIWKNDEGEKQDDTTFVDVTLWGKLAEVTEKYLRKGRPVFIEGRLQLDSWDDKQTGQKRSRLKVVAEIEPQSRSPNQIWSPGKKGQRDIQAWTKLVVSV